MLAGFRCSVTNEDYEKMVVEGSAILDISALCPYPQPAISISRHSKRFYCYNFAPFGIGRLVNSIEPFVDCANNFMPFGTQLIFDATDKDLQKDEFHPAHFNPWYVGDSFGKSNAANQRDRVDLFTTRKIRINQTCIAKVTEPTLVSDTHKELIINTQKMLNKKFNSALTVDGIEGPNTLTALNKAARRFNVPVPRSCANSELYFMLTNC
jgi:hypothetical protein